MFVSSATKSVYIPVAGRLALGSIDDWFLYLAIWLRSVFLVCAEAMARGAARRKPLSHQAMRSLAGRMRAHVLKAGVHAAGEAASLGAPPAQIFT